MSTLFATLRADKRAAFIPYLMAGFPNPELTVKCLSALAEGGADAIELGIPFSDPMADGPVIQHAAERALAVGVNLRMAFEMAAAFRKLHPTPLYFMSYANPIAAYGPDRFFDDAARVRLSGVIIPDLPPEESAGWSAHTTPLVYLCAPTTSARRVQLIDRASRDFIYLVSMRGITGASLPPGVSSFVTQTRRLTSHPLCVGFGISTPDQARRLARVADGIIVGSALIRTIDDWGGGKMALWAARRFVSKMRAACRRTN